jgi:hypothetical protein
MIHFFWPGSARLPRSNCPVHRCDGCRGALRNESLLGIPDEVTGGWQRGDDRFATSCRPVGESVVASLTAATRASPFAVAWQSQAC